jgi:hypothetical protein
MGVRLVLAARAVAELVQAALAELVQPTKDMQGVMGLMLNRVEPRVEVAVAQGKLVELLVHHN